MSYQIKANYEQEFLFPPSLEDWITKDHPSRFIREFVENLDLKELGFKVLTNDEGRPYYSSDLLLKVWIYGYFQKVRSSRKLEKQCKENVSLIWLSGMNYPDHNTLWRFWNENKEKLKGALGTDVDGSGLGLAIVREIAAQHDAQVTLEDANLRHRPGLSEQAGAAFGPGARFTLRFPARGAEGAVAAPQPRVPGASFEGQAVS